MYSLDSRIRCEAQVGLDCVDILEAGACFVIAQAGVDDHTVSLDVPLADMPVGWGGHWVRIAELERVEHTEDLTKMPACGGGI